MAGTWSIALRGEHDRSHPCGKLPPALRRQPHQKAVVRDRQQPPTRASQRHRLRATVRSRQQIFGSVMNFTPASSSFRLAELADAELVRRISAEAYVPAYLPVIGAVPKPALEDYGERIEHGQVWILTDKASTAGVLVLERGEDWLTVYSIAVRPAFQGLGLGRLLLDWAEHRASAAGVAELRLYTNARMKNNLALYQRCGYEIFNTRPHPSRPGELLVDLKRPATARL